MPRGVNVFEVIEEMHIDPVWARAILGISANRYSRLRHGTVLFTYEEVEKLAKAMREIYGVSRRRLFDKDADILPPGRRRRAKGTVTKESAVAQWTPRLEAGTDWEFF